MTTPYNPPGPFLPPKPTLKWERVKPGYYRGGITTSKRKKPKKWPFYIKRNDEVWYPRWTLYDNSKCKKTVVMNFGLLEEAKQEAFVRVFDEYYDQRLRTILTYKLGEDGFQYLEKLKNRLEEAEGRLKKLEAK